jgi:hypothetical protein
MSENYNLMPMKWSPSGNRPNDTDYCACCDRFVVAANRHTVEVTADMADAITVGPDCARKHLPGFTTLTGAA